jgi:hypothetical protein
VSADRLAEVRTDARSHFREEDENNKAIVDRWFTNFWGKSYNPAIIDELTERNVFFGHSLYTPQIGPASLKTFMAELREAFSDFSVEKRLISLPRATQSWFDVEPGLIAGLQHRDGRWRGD